MTSCTQNAIGGSNKIKYVFSCSGCESDVSVWIRLGVSPLITVGKIMIINGYSTYMPLFWSTSEGLKFGSDCTTGCLKKNYWIPVHECLPVEVYLTLYEMLNTIYS